MVFGGRVDRDYTHVFFGLVVFAGVIAMLLMVAPDGAQNRIGAAGGTPVESPVESAEVQEYVFSQGTEVVVAGKELRSVSSNTVSIDNIEREITFGEVYSLDPRRTFMIEEGTLYIFDTWEADSCEGITGQTRATSPSNICCDGQSVPLPDCSAGDDPIQCGEKRIYCEDRQLKSEVVQ